MKKSFLKFAAVFMAVIMTAVYLPLAEIDTVFDVDASAIVTNGKVNLGSNIKWNYDNKSRTITVSGSGAMYNYKNGDDGQRWDELVLGLTHYPNKDAENIVIKEGITSIGDHVFNGLKNVKKVTIPSTITSIGASAFEGCSSLSSVTLPANLKTIGANAFKNTKFASVKMPDGVTSVSSNSFSGVSGLKIICNYNTPAYEALIKNSVPFSFPENKLVLDAKFDTVNKQILVNLKMIYNKAELNAGNFNLTFGSAVEPVSTETGYTSANGVSLATVYHEGKVSFAMMAETSVPLSTSLGTSVYDFGTIAFKAEGQDPTADFVFAAETLMMNNAKTSIKQASANVVLHIYEEKIEKAATCVAEGLKKVECSLCGLVKETVVIPVDASKHGETEVKNKKDATCNTAGYSGDTYCKLCNAVVTKGSDIPATGNHNYDAVVTAATCQSGGYTTYTCKDCGYSYVGNETAKAGHDYEAVVTPATCTDAGYTTYTCKTCSDSYKGDFTADLGHDFGADGKCSRCDEVTVLSVTFTDNTGITVDDEAKTIIIRKTLKSGELSDNIASGNWNLTKADGTAVAADTAVSTGCILKSATTDTAYTVVILGDVNGDGRITASDARSVLRVASRLDKSDDLFNLAADCDGKTKITASDARVVLRVASKLQSF